MNNETLAKENSRRFTTMVASGADAFERGRLLAHTKFFTNYRHLCVTLKRENYKRWAVYTVL